MTKSLISVWSPNKAQRFHLLTFSLLGGWSRKLLSLTQAQFRTCLHPLFCTVPKKDQEKKITTQCRGLGSTSSPRHLAIHTWRELEKRFLLWMMGNGRETGAASVGSRWSKSDSAWVDNGRFTAGDAILNLPASRCVTGQSLSFVFVFLFYGFR